jgi:tetratricopeptide (TPR) repeat protein
MKRFLGPSKVGLVGLALCLTMVGAWALHRQKAVPPAVTKSDTAANALTALPPVASDGGTLTDKTIAQWAALVRKEPGNVIDWNNLGAALMQKARETADAAYYTHAERAYRQALTLNPRSVDALVGMAWIDSGRHAFEESMNWAHKALALDPKSNDAYGLIGDAQVEIGDYDAALTAYQQMLDIRPDIASYSRGAHLLWLTNDKRKATWLMYKAIRTGAPYAENTAWCQTQLALILFNGGALVPAEQTLASVLKGSPDNYRALALMGRLKAVTKDYQAAIGYYQKSIAVVPQVDSLAALGDLFVLTGQAAEAEKQFALVDTIDHLNKANGVRGGWQRAMFLADHDRELPKALQEAQEEYATRKNVYAADTLAWCLYKNGRTQEAADMIQKTLKYSTPEALFSFHAGMIYNKMGDRRTASLCLARALSMNGSFHPTYVGTAADTLRQLGSQTGAERLAVLPAGSR